jgi:hypothetical protein
MGGLYILIEVFSPVSGQRCALQLARQRRDGHESRLQHFMKENNIIRTSIFYKK